jgi:septation ring formation regulator EzrA
VQVGRLNVQRQDRFTWEPSFAVVRSFRDQALRVEADSRVLANVDAAVTRAEGFVDNGRLRQAAAELDSAESQLKGTEFDDLNDAVDDLADLYKDRDKDD